MKCTITTAALGLTVLLTSLSAHAEFDRKAYYAMKAKMQKAQMQELNFKDAKVTEVIDFLAEESRRIDPAGVGFNLVYMPGTKKPAKKVAAQPAKADPFLADIFDLDVQDAAQATPAFDPETRITLRLRRVSMYDALKYITEMAGLSFRIQKNVVVIRPAGQGGHVETRFYAIDPALMQKQIQAIQAAQRQQNPDPFDF